MSTSIHHYLGWRPDMPDQRDYVYAVNVKDLRNLPASVDLRPLCSPILDQGQLGSCTANSIAAAIMFDQIKQGLQVVTPSRLFVYYNERSMEGTTASDAGAMIRDGVKSVNRQGACAEDLWPYDISKFTIKPSIACYQAALQHKALSYQRVTRSLAQMKACLSSGYGFVFGFSVYASFESQQVATTGIVPMPMHHEQLLGGHAVLCVGFDDAQQRFIVQNSWGTSWGQAGFFTIPYAYLLSANLSSDFWTIRTVA